MPLKPYFHGTTSRMGAPSCGGNARPYSPLASNRQRVHRLVHPQALDIRPVQHVAPLSRHALGIQQSLEGDILRVAERLDHIEQFGQRKTHPRNHHGPRLDAAHPVNPLLRRTDFQQIVQVEDPGLSHQALDRHLPAFGVKLRCRRRNSFLVGRELVEIVVMRDVLKGGLLVGNTKAVRPPPTPPEAL